VGVCALCLDYATSPRRPPAVLPKPLSTDKKKPAPQPDTEEKKQTVQTQQIQQQQHVINELKNRLSQREEQLH